MISSRARRAGGRDVRRAWLWKETANPVDVNFPTTKLSKYAASLITKQQVGSLLSKFSFSDLNINDMLRKYLSASSDPAEPDSSFRAACNWVKENYAVWNSGSTDCRYASSSRTSNTKSPAVETRALHARSCSNGGTRTQPTLRFRTTVTVESRNCRVRS